MNQEGFTIISSQNKRKVLYIVRAEADFERAVCLGIAGKNYFDQHFIFVGDSGLFFNQTIQNKFQKSLFFSNGFKIDEYFKYDLIALFLSKLAALTSASPILILIPIEFLFRTLNLINLLL